MICGTPSEWVCYSLSMATNLTWGTEIAGLAVRFRV